MYFNKKYQERASAQSEFEKEIEQGIDNRIQADHEDSSNHNDYGDPQHPQQEFYDLNEELFTPPNKYEIVLDCLSQIDSISLLCTP